MEGFITFLNYDFKRGEANEVLYVQDEGEFARHDGIVSEPATSELPAMNAHFLYDTPTCSRNEANLLVLGNAGTPMTRRVRTCPQMIMDATEPQVEFGTLSGSCGEDGFPVTTSVPAALGSAVAWVRDKKTLEDQKGALITKLEEEVDLADSIRRLASG